MSYYRTPNGTHTILLFVLLLAVFGLVPAEQANGVGPIFYDDFESGKKDQWKYYEAPVEPNRVTEINDDIYKETPTHSLYISNLYGNYWGEDNGVAYATLDTNELPLTIPYTIEFWFYPSQSAYYPYYNCWIILETNQDINLWMSNDPGPGHITLHDGDGWRLITELTPSFALQSWNKIKYTRTGANSYRLQINDETVWTGDPYGDSLSDIPTFILFGDRYPDFAKGEAYWDDILICSGTYDLTITPTSGGTTDPNIGTYTYPYGFSVEVNAIPDVNYALDHWELDGNDVGPNNPYLVVMDSNHTLHAVFTDFTYNLTITATPNGTTDPPPETYIYAANSVAEVKAIPDECYEFDHWELDGNDAGPNNPYSILMDSNYMLNGVFVPVTDDYDLTITATSDGTTDPAPGIYIYGCGSSVEVNAVPDPNYVLDHWERDGNDAGSDNPYAVLMDSNHTLHAVFLRDADLNHNCHVDWSDLGIFGDWWLASDCCELNWCDGADLDESNDVTWADFPIFAWQWLKCITDCTCTDMDGDGYANPASVCCLFPELDCNDNDPNINPGAEEICDDSIDNDCDGLTDYADPDCGPECWKCAYQCHGDADCLPFGRFQYRVSIPDADIFNAAWMTAYPDPNYNPCADFDRDGNVDFDDQAIMDTWWQVVGVPPNCPPGGTWPPE